MLFFLNIIFSMCKMEPNIWGPGAWTFLHSITFQYPENPTDLKNRNIILFLIL